MLVSDNQLSSIVDYGSLRITPPSSQIYESMDKLEFFPSRELFVSGAIAVRVGFGAKKIINDFISSGILMWERPIRIGVENSSRIDGRSKARPSGDCSPGRRTFCGHRCPRHFETGR